MVNKNVLSCLLKDGKEVNAVMLVGRLFHARATVTQNDRSPMVLSRVRGFQLSTVVLLGLVTADLLSSSNKGARCGVGTGVCHGSSKNSRGARQKAEQQQMRTVQWCS